MTSKKEMHQKLRFEQALECFYQEFGKCDDKGVNQKATPPRFYRAPGRTEIGGNHTDHQKGKVLAAAINLDSIAVVAANDADTVTIVSKGFGRFNISLDNLEAKKEEEGTTLALTKGVMVKLQEAGFKLGGFEAYITSDVLPGSGLSSSASYEVLIGTIISDLYNDMKIPAVQIAIAGQYAENVYFGKPCGLMDQMACAMGSMIYIDFLGENDCVDNFTIKQVQCDLETHGYQLCITDTKGSHADLTDEYAAVPSEMKKIAAFFNKDVLAGISIEDIYQNIDELRALAGDRAVLRAIHFINENKRVEQQFEALEQKDFDTFLGLVKESGNSSYKYLQNVYTSKAVKEQKLSLALALSEMFLGKDGACRVHGGGFAGTIQAYVKNEKVEEYKAYMDKVFGEGACVALSISKYGPSRVYPM